LKKKLVSIIIGASGTVKRGLYQKIQLLLAHRSVTELKKSTLMSTAHSVREALG